MGPTSKGRGGKGRGREGREGEMRKGREGRGEEEGKGRRWKSGAPHFFVQVYAPVESQLSIRLLYSKNCTTE